ncbi:glycoside hydrolase family 79 protein [Bipolaris sorokiniana ND90Pr]|uniref:Glycoside hydrolase family 79 protein n=1 Tax=Cochliobolus sativus (strain ND90Pr / ATCC 201652) TaxID=665912 RepID=M2T660_COCSN|nr:glycoside hydrolase family 79 protein [Bipolaris sorokiniana ND90Pr]EMD69915.1 glycoside hydrolase family 79 protein [Bipolaris sorokiniana ND90Pr]
MFSTRSTATALAVAILSLPAARAQSLSISPNTKAPRDASDYINPSFAGFGIEPSNLFSFTGGDQINQFSIKLLQNLADYSGAPPHIRLGGNTQDYMLFEADNQRFAWNANKNSQAQGTKAADAMIIGPNYFTALDRFPKDTPVTFGLNMAYMESDWETRITDMAKAAIDGMKNVKLYSFEVGNEPDLWLQNMFRAGAWSGSTYTTQWLDRCEVVYERVLKNANLPSSFFEAPATASTIGTTFEIAQLVDDGIMEGRNGDNFLATWNQHDYYYFIGVTPTPLTLDELMDLDTTNVQFKYWEKQVGIALKTGLPYVLREMSSVGPIGMPFVSDVFGAALWTMNFFLYAASIGISSVQMHMTDNSNASAWQPIPMYGRDTSFVRPQYYAHAAVAQIIGNGNGTTQIKTERTSDVGAGYDGRIRVYSAYANDKLQSVTMINAKQVNASTSTKGSFTFNLNLGSENANKEVFISYLTAPGADSQTDVTWNGMKYDDITGESSAVDSTVVVTSTDGSGKITVPVRDSEAVVANIGNQLGVNAVITPNGTQSKKSSAASKSVSSAGFAAITGMLAVLVGLAVV